MKLTSARHSWVTGYQKYYIVLWKQTKNCQLVITNYSLSQNGWDSLGSPCPLNVGAQELVTKPQ